jgi:hypothetical protein
VGQFFGRLLTVANCGLTRRKAGDSIDFYEAGSSDLQIVGSSKDKVFNEEVCASAMPRAVGLIVGDAALQG